MDRSRRTESGRQPAIRSSAPWRHGRTATRQVRPHRAQPASDTGSVATDGRPSQRPSRLVDQSVERGHSRNPTTPGQIAADTWPAGLPRPPPASPAPGLTEPTAERLAERADAADTRRLGHATAGHRTAGHPTAGHRTAGHPTAGHRTAGPWTPATRTVGPGTARPESGRQTVGTGRRRTAYRRPCIPDQRDDAAYLGPPSEDTARQAPPAAIGNQDCLAVNTATAILAMAATRQLHGGTPRSRLRLGALLSSEK